MQLPAGEGKQPQEVKRCQCLRGRETAPDAAEGLTDELAGRADGPPDVVVFLDADFSDHPDELDLLLEPIRSGDADMVIGSRLTGRRERGAMPPRACGATDWRASS